jgi:hypothetical protein
MGDESLGRESKFKGVIADTRGKPDFKPAES